MNRSSFCLLVVVVFVFLPMQSCEETPADAPLDFRNPMIKPMVTYTYPPMNSIGPYPAAEMRNPNRIELRFNKIMETETLMKAITVSSSRFATDYNRTSVGSDGERYYVYPMDSVYHYLNLNEARLYEQFTLRVATTARDVNGNSLDREFRVSFIPEPYFRVRSVHPEDGMLNYQWSQITVYLNSEIRKEMISKFTWEPRVAGDWISSDYDSTYLQFRFAPQLLPDSITLTVSDDLVDIHGNRLGKAFRKIFTRAPFRMYSPGEYVSLSGPVSFRFSQPIDSTTIHSSFQITPEVPGTLSLGPGGNILLFQQANDLDQFSSYEIVIDTTIRSIFGETIGNPRSCTIKTRAFTLQWSHPRPGEVDAARGSYIGFEFNEPLDSSTFRDAFRISPEVLGEFVPNDRNYMTFMPEQSLTPLTVYTITVSTDLKTKGGTNLMMPAVVSFMTGK